MIKPEDETETKVNEKIETERLQNKEMFSSLYKQGYKIGERVANTQISTEEAKILAKKLLL